MSSISSISGASSLWSVTSTSSSSSTTDAFSQAVSNLQSGKAANDSGSSSDEETTTITKVLSDGSVLVTVVKDGQIVSETKTRSSNPDEQATSLDPSKDPMKANGMALTMDKFNDTSTSITAGSLFSANA